MESLKKIGYKLLNSPNIINKYFHKKPYMASVALSIAILKPIRQLNLFSIKKTYNNLQLVNFLSKNKIWQKISLPKPNIELKLPDINNVYNKIYCLEEISLNCLKYVFVKHGFTIVTLLIKHLTIMYEHRNLIKTEHLTEDEKQLFALENQKNAYEKLSQSINLYSNIELALLAWTCGMCLTTVSPVMGISCSIFHFMFAVTIRKTLLMYYQWQISSIELQIKSKNLIIDAQ